MINFFWPLFKWGVILSVLAALLLGGYLYVRIDDQIRQHVERVLSDHYAGLQVQVAAARLDPEQGIEIRGIAIGLPGADLEHDALILIGELNLACQPTLENLLSQKLDIESIVVRRPRLRAARNAEGQWTTAQLMPWPKFGDSEPEIRIEDGRLEVARPQESGQTPFVLQDVDLRVTRQKTLDATGVEQQQMSVEGSVRGEFFERIEIAAAIDPAAQRWRAKGKVHALRACPELCGSLPAALPAPWNRAAHLNALGTIEFDVQGTGTSTDDLQIETQCQIARGSFDDPLLPESLTDLTASVRLQNNTLFVDELTGRMGKTRLRVTLRREGLVGGGPTRIVVNVSRLRLESELLRSMPQEARLLWNKYLPAGEIDLDGELVHDGQKWTANALVTCHDVAFSHYKFPYRLDKGEGTLRLRGEQLSVDLTAMSGSRPIKIRAEIQNPGPAATGWGEVRGSDLSVTPRLAEALPEKARPTFQMLAPSGKFQVYWRGWRDDPREEKFHTHLLLSTTDGSIRYEKFPYPISNIRGTVEMRDDRWTFSDLEGTNDSGFVTCQGTLLPSENGTELTLQFAGTQIALEDELRDALPSAAQNVWRSLRPRGKLDLTSTVVYRSAAKSLDVKVRLEPLGDSASIEPVDFPYRMENLEGAITYDNGRVTIESLRADHGQTRLFTRGSAEGRPDGSWYLSLDGLSIDQAEPQRELLIALPAGLRKAIADLSPTGLINLQGTFGLARGPHAYSPLQCRWDMGVNMHQGTLNVGVELRNVFGQMQFSGTHDGEKFQSTGELAIDSLSYLDFQFTEIRGPVWIDDQQVLLGAWAEKKQGRDQNPRRITGKLYGGKLIGDGWATLEKTPRFGLTTSLVGGDLAQVARESLRGQEKIKGNILGQLNLQGNASGLHSLVGNGEIQLQNADIYQLPLTVALLKVLQARVPDTTAFNASRMKFRVAGPHLYYDQFDLYGDVLSLYGKGEMDLDRRIRLTFHSQIGPGQLAVPVWRRLVGEASQQIMQIHVNGTLENPQITNEVFPAVSEALQQLQADLQPGGPRRVVPSTTNNRLPQTR